MKRIFSKINAILFLIALLLGILSVGYFKYTLFINKVREAYQIELPMSTEFYNAQELNEYEKLLAKKELAFENLNVNSLQQAQKEIIDLDVVVNTRLFKEYFGSFKIKVMGLQLINANTEEELILKNEQQKLLNEILQEINPQTIKYIGVKSENNYYFSFLKIKEEYEKSYQSLLELQQKLQQEINERIEQKQQAVTNDDVLDYSENDNKPASSLTPPIGQDPPTNESEVSPPVSEETCVTKPSGAIVCVGGDW